MRKEIYEYLFFHNEKSYGTMIVINADAMERELIPDTTPSIKNCKMERK